MSFEPRLHWSFDNEHILLSSLVLNSFANFTAAATVVAAICLAERFVTSAPRVIEPIAYGFIRLLSFLLDAGWVPASAKAFAVILCCVENGSIFLRHFSTIVRTACYYASECR